MSGGYQGKGDAHPKCENLQEALLKKVFRGGVKLNFHRTPHSRVTDKMISKGPSSLSNDEVEIWLEDIKLKHYTIVRTNETKDHPKLNAGEEEEDNSDESDTASIPLNLVDGKLVPVGTGMIESGDE